MSSLRKQYEVSEGGQPAPAPPAPWAAALPGGAASSPSRVLCCRRPCREPTAWKPSWSNSESSCWPPNDRPAVQGWGCSGAPAGPALGGSGHPCAWGWARALPSLPLPSFFFTARSRCRGREPCRGARQPSGVRWLCFNIKSALVSTAVPVPSVFPGGKRGSLPRWHPLLLLCWCVCPSRCVSVPGQELLVRAGGRPSLPPVPAS